MSQVKPIPDGYHSVQPYVMQENCAEAMAFYGKAFGAKEKLRIPDAQGRIMHAEIEIGDSCHDGGRSAANRGIQRRAFRWRPDAAHIGEGHSK